MTKPYTPAALPENEAWRLQSLHDLKVLDSAPEAEFDALVKVASLVCGVPIALVSLVDVDRQWFKADVGLGAQQTPRDLAFCAYTILGEDVFEVPDALLDPRFAGNPLVQQAPDIRFYAGAPITLDNGARVGTLCVIDREPKQLTATQREILQQLAVAASQALEARKVLGSEKELAVVAAHDAAVQQAQATQRRLESALQEARTLADTIDIHAIVSETDRHGVITHCNDAFERISGYTRAELIGQNQRIVNAGHHPQSFWEDMWSTISQGTPWRGDICNRAKNGRLYWVDSMIAPFIGNDGLVEKYVSIRTDITQRVQDQRRLDEMSTRMSLAIEGGNDGLWDWPDVHQKAQWWSPSYYALLGYDDQELTPSCNSYRALLHPDSLAVSRQAKQQILAGMGSIDVEVQLRTKSAGYGWFRVRGKVGFDTQGRAVRVAGSTQDITERKRYERELQAARAEAEAAARSKGQFLANMSHEIRTPMNAILGLLNLLQSTELTARQIDYASKTEGAAKSLLGLLNDILDFSKVEAGKMSLESHPFRIDKVLRDLSVVLSANVGAKDVEVLFDLDTSLPVVVRGDAMRLQQVLVNLAGNAIKFTAQGQVVLALRTQAMTDTTAAIEFSVRDTGIGIAQEHQAHIFSGFSQAEGSTTRRFGGTGLGLAISKRLVEMMGGDIQITSTPGAGSTFSFVLQMPLVAVVPHELAMAQRPTLAPQRVLVVEDNPVAGELMLRMVRSWGWTADLAESGTRALELVSASCADDPIRLPYSLIYMDWQLPDTDGWEATRHIRQWVQSKGLVQPVVIMVTAHGRETLAQRTLDEQDMLNGFLVKPVTASMLYDSVMDAGSGNSGLRLAAKGRSNARQLSGMRILVVEDNLINQQVADELLSAAGAIVSLAANGQIGVDAVAAAAPQFDVVLMDVQMPVLDGYGATAAIRGRLGLAQLPIIAMTANAMASDRDACMAAGMNEHIGKPFDMAWLVALLLRMTGFQKQAGPALDAPDALAPRLPEVPGLDLHTALGRMSGMRGLYVRTARDFIKIMDTVVPDLQQCLASGDQQMAMMRLHTLKGNAGTLGAVVLAANAARLETLCKAGGGMQECEQGLADFALLVQSTQRCLQDAIASLDPTPMRTAAPAADPLAQGVTSDALRRIAALAAADDLDVLQCFAEAREALCGLPDDGLERLDEALQNLDLPAAHALCQDMLCRV